MARTRNVPLHEYGWEFLMDAEKREPHPPAPMISAQSKSPPYFWTCSVGRCNRYAFTYHRDEPPPICTGGFPWSFSTTSYASIDGSAP